MLTIHRRLRNSLFCMYSKFSRARRAAGVVMVSWPLLFAQPALAWDGSMTGKIVQIDVTSGSNFGFRIFLTGGPTMCTGGSSFAYLNETDSNYKVYVAQLTIAKLAGNQVTIYTNNQGGYCQIGYVLVGA